MKPKLARPTTVDADTTAPTQEALKAKAEIANSTRALLIQTNTLTITTTADMAKADQYLGEVNAAIKKVDARFDPIIDPISKALTMLRKFKKEVMAPLETAKESLRTGMAGFERRRLEIEMEAQRVEAQRLQAEAFAKQQMELKAKTAQMRDRLAAQREEIEARAKAVEEAPVMITGSMPSSGMAIIKRWRITDAAAFYRGLADGVIPSQTVTLVAGVMNAAARSGEMDSWPGCEVYDDVQVRSR